MSDRTPAERRKALGLSRMQLAATLGIDVSTLWRYETGKQPAPPWLALALEALEGRAIAQPPRSGQ
jgi:transcriptional regulator with XRE-family HTH domain